MRRPSFFLAMLLMACGAPSSETQSQSDDIIGGAAAESPELDAVGTLGIDVGEGPRPFCSGTLITPQLVLTAKHCALKAGDKTAKILDKTNVYFLVGADALHPKRTIPAAVVHLSPVADAGWLGLGNDIALYQLAAPVPDVTPIPVAPGQLRDADVGASFQVVGFGSQNAEETISGTRQIGKVTLQATSGRPLQKRFATEQDLLTFVETSDGRAFVDANAEKLRAAYARELLGESEIFGGNAQGDVRTCHGDSGGPLLQVIGGKRHVAGVTSAGLLSGKSSCTLGTVFASLGPRVHELLDWVSQGPVHFDPPAGLPGFRTDGIYETGFANPGYVRFTTEGWFCTTNGPHPAAADRLCGPPKSTSGEPYDDATFSFTSKGPIETTNATVMSLPLVQGKRRTVVADVDRVSVVTDVGGRLVVFTYRFVSAILPVDPEGTRRGLATNGVYQMTTTDKPTYFRFDKNGGVGILETDAPLAEASAKLKLGTDPAIERASYARTRFWNIELRGTTNPDNAASCSWYLDDLVDRQGIGTLMCGNYRAAFQPDP